ncbi:hypothetical protein [Streptomyces sp. NPDC001851]|uniref:hypothetical protein n=1 Tax=Streptomyces sp. NPDC001851 TaxID=3154529 RepID=UPI0033232B75
MNHTYEPPSLIPAPGEERTYALVIAGVPLLLILLMAVLPLLASGGGNASGATSADGQGGYTYTPPPADPPAPDTSTAYGTEPSTPLGGDDSTGLSPTPLDESAPSTDGTGSPDSTDSSGSADSSTGPGKTVNDFFDAINRRDFKTAWALGGKNLDRDYDSFVAGFDTTEHDDVFIESVDGGTVSVNLNAQQSDGTQKSFTGQYTVVDGVITHASMTSAG